MSLLALDHVNLRTTKLHRLETFYVDVLGLAKGPRPDFPFGGSWLYVGDRAVVHLVEVEDEPDRPERLHMEHVAFRGAHFEAFVARLERKLVDYRLTHIAVPLENGEYLKVAQVNLYDPDGNRLHVDFVV